MPKRAVVNYVGGSSSSASAGSLVITTGQLLPTDKRYVYFTPPAGVAGDYSVFDGDQTACELYGGVYDTDNDVCSAGSGFFSNGVALTLRLPDAATANQVYTLVNVSTTQEFYVAEESLSYPEQLFNVAASATLEIQKVAGVWKQVLDTDTGGLALGETSADAYRGDRGKIAYDHSQTTHNKAFVGLPNVDDTSDANKPVSSATQTALDLKANLAGATFTGPLTGTSGIIQQRNSTTAQQYEIYGTYTDTSNYVGLRLASSSTATTISAITAGTGADNVDINLTPAGTGRVFANNGLSVNSPSLLAVAGALSVGTTTAGVRGLQVHALDGSLGFYLNCSGASRSGTNNTCFQLDTGTNTVLAVNVRNPAGTSVHTVSQAGLVTCTTLQVNGTYTDASNYVRAAISSNGTSSITLAAETAGTGADNVDIVLTPAGTGYVKATRPISTNRGATYTECFGELAGNAITASGQYNTFIGHRSGEQVSTGTRNTAVGWVAGPTTSALGTTCCFGWAATSSATGGVAFGYEATVSALNGLAFGYQTIASGTNAIAVGPNVTASGTRTIVIGGSYANLGDTDTVALGYGRTNQVPTVAFIGGADTDVTTNKMVTIVNSWVSNVQATRKARAVFNIWDTAAREAIRLEASGTAPMLGFLGANAIARPTTASTAATFAANTSAIANDTATFDGYTIGQIVKALRDFGLLT
jgi:hypothetical protein